MAAPLIAKVAADVAAQKVVPFFKKHPWLIPAAIVSAVAAIIMSTILLFGAIAGVENIKFPSKECATETFSVEAFPDGLWGLSLEEIGAELQNCDGLGVGQYGTWALPSTGSISSFYGPRSSKCGAANGGCSSSVHPGLDMAPGCSAPIFAAAAGTVTFAGHNGGYGNHIRIDHGNGIETSYSHIRSGGLKVFSGDVVTPGQKIAEVGNTGASFGCHLHLEIYINGEKTDPVPFLMEQGVNILNLNGVQEAYIKASNHLGWLTMQSYCNTSFAKKLYFCPGGLSRADTPPPATDGANPVNASGSAQKYAQGRLPSYNWRGGAEFGCLVKLWNRESNWRTNAQNNNFAPSKPHSPQYQAYGIPQAGPGGKMSSKGSDWRTNYKTQIDWGLGYIKDRYGSPCGAWAHSESYNWY